MTLKTAEMRAPDPKKIHKSPHKYNIPMTVFHTPGFCLGRRDGPVIFFMIT